MLSTLILVHGLLDGVDGEAAGAHGQVRPGEHQLGDPFEADPHGERRPGESCSLGVGAQGAHFEVERPLPPFRERGGRPGPPRAQEGQPRAARRARL